jgi:hypothetical protein
VTECNTRRFRLLSERTCPSQAGRRGCASQLANGWEVAPGHGFRPATSPLGNPLHPDCREVLTDPPVSAVWPPKERCSMLGQQPKIAYLYLRLVSALLPSGSG